MKCAACGGEMHLMGAVPLGEWEKEHGGPPVDAGEYQLYACSREGCKFMMKRKRDGTSSNDLSFNEWRK